MRNIYAGKIPPLTCNEALPSGGCICKLPEGHTDDHCCQFCEVTWTNSKAAPPQDNIRAVKETDERWIEALGWTDLVHSAPYTQLDRKYYVKLFAESLQKEHAKSNAAGLGAFLIASLEEEKTQRKANFDAWQAACATISRLLAEVAELKKALGAARAGYPLRQLRWKL